ncbi:hypothetical protein ZWY2020_003021 [Hordeum vulgare]|nr:hypothetical protein ZWY2020_003021 [Hordeum vulgare]
MVKIRVDELRDMPSSIIVGESNDLNSESWTVQVVIIQHEMIGEGPPEQDPIHVDGKPHPLPLKLNFHPDKLNHFIGPIMEHQADDDMGNGLHPPQENGDQGEEDEDMPEWGHSDMPVDEDDIMDHELEEGEFMELVDMFQPLNDHIQDEMPDMDNESNITLSLVQQEVNINVDSHNEELPSLKDFRGASLSHNFISTNDRDYDEELEGCGDLFALDLAKGEDPTLQLVDHWKQPASPDRDSNFSLPVDEAFEIIEESVNHNNAEIKSSVPQVSESEFSASSAPPGYITKGKYLPIDGSLKSMHNKDHEGLDVWKQYFSVVEDNASDIQILEREDQPMNPSEATSVAPESAFSQGKRKTRVPVVDLEVDGKARAEDGVHKKRAKKGAKQPAWKE